jgi:hypothetical protein
MPECTNPGTLAMMTIFINVPISALWTLKVNISYNATTNIKEEDWKNSVSPNEYNRSRLLYKVIICRGKE